MLGNAVTNITWNKGPGRGGMSALLEGVFRKDISNEVSIEQELYV